ncbi:aminotransferase class I/II-fold pyridoxal phosphate-dependent enzyme [Mesorhizobium retamae]|uniref:aspartate transaminase n=1 Tax=Mesorhizobium retamae TaxID=2912854 RepID=A0ABS9QPL3_9HYPH|nr:aminotransferase class I/II-fold pyridoxal phosphate-dependent enzyme [Mesorhizobium sp. IRAMC:0171]MCG7508499.1 aminotransferase class I/II-fold pyridoxal phosphate-dependent enzyme [Mesorhizobium sp. IRAMC:0171]
MLAQRTKLFASSGTAAARAAAKAAADAGKEVIDLTAGEIWCDLAPRIREGALAAIERGENRYTDTVGLRELREALAAKVSRETGQVWQADEIAVTSGAKQALFNTAMVLLDPGDEVIIPSPYWTTFPAQVLIAGGRPVHVDTRDNGFVPKPEELERAITAKTRAIVVNSPSNPTGVVYDQTTLELIANLAIRHDLWIIFDECYGAFAHAPHVHHPIVSLVPEARSRTIIINAFSKTLALTGWRIGYLAAPKSVIDAVKALQSHTTSNPNVIAQHAVLEHLRHGDGSYERRLFDQLTLARRLGLDILSRQAIAPPPKAQGGFYFYLDLSGLAQRGAISTAPRTADDAVNALLAEAGVAGVSGSAFGDPMGLRLSYGIDHNKLTRGLERLVETVDAWTSPSRNVA